MKNYSTVWKVAPAFLLLGAMMQAQVKDSVAKEKKIDEVVLIGYGKQKKADLTGSITSVTAKDFNTGSTSPEQLIQGKAPGVQISSNGGAPGGGSVIRIRGGASLNASNDPLIVIDGVPMDNKGLSGSGNPLSLINPNDIESFDLLKDASSTAIYGSRASNGVIIITTKKGSAGKVKVNFSTLASVSTKMKNLNVFSADEFRSFVAAHATPEYQSYLGKADTNWQDKIYQTAWGTDNNLSLSGGIKWLPYRISAGYNEQNGIVRTNTFKRTTLGINLSPKFFDNHLTVSINGKGTFSENRFPNGGAIGAAEYFDPTQPVYNNDTRFGGYFEWLQNPLDSASDMNDIVTRNPVSMLYSKRDISSVWRGIGNIELNYKFHFLPELRINVNGGYDYSKANGSVSVAKNSAIGYRDGGSYNEYSAEVKNKLFDTYLNYSKLVNGINTNVDLTVGYSYQDFWRMNPGSTTYYGNKYKVTSLDKGTQSTLIGYFARGIFTIANKYILTASIRRDGSSRFSPDNRWGYFPAAAFAWKISEEDFAKNASISNLKLRVGYGITGQQDLGNDYPYLAYFTGGDSGAQYQFGNQFVSTLRAAAYDPNLKWESTKTANIGLDFGFLNNRITGSVDIYKKNTKDLLSFVPNAAGSNNSNYWLTNVGEMENKGIEANLNFVPVKNDNLTWDLGFNVSAFDSKILNLSKTNDPNVKILKGGIAGGNGGNIEVLAAGQQPYAFYVYKQKYDANGAALAGQYEDLNGDGIINDADKYYYKSATVPKATLGFNTKVTYKNWDFGMAMRAVLGNYVYNNAASNSSLQGLSINKSLSNMFADQAYYQYDDKRIFSDIFVEDASFLRLDNVTLGYNFGDVFGDRSSLRIFASGQNLFVVTKYKGIDPEVTSMSFNNGFAEATVGIDNGYYQRPRVYSLGLNFQF